MQPQLRRESIIIDRFHCRQDRFHCKQVQPHCDSTMERVGRANLPRLRAPLGRGTQRAAAATPQRAATAANAQTKVTCLLNRSESTWPTGSACPSTAKTEMFVVFQSGCNRTALLSLRTRRKSQSLSRDCGPWSEEFLRGLNSQPTRPRLRSPSSATFSNDARSSCATISCHDHSLMSSSTNE